MYKTPFSGAKAKDSIVLDGKTLRKDNSLFELMIIIIVFIVFFSW